MTIEKGSSKELYGKAANEKKEKAFI